MITTSQSEHFRKEEPNEAKHERTGVRGSPRTLSAIYIVSGTPLINLEHVWHNGNNYKLSEFRFLHDANGEPLTCKNNIYFEYHLIVEG